MTVEHISDERLAEMLAATEHVPNGDWTVDGWEIISSQRYPIATIDRHSRDAEPIKAHLLNCHPDTIAALLTELQYRREAETKAEPFCYVREWPAFFDPHTGGEPATTDFSDVPKPGYEPLFKAATPSTSAVRVKAALLDLEIVRKAVFGDVGDCPDIYADYDRANEMSRKMSDAIHTLTGASP